MHNVGLVIESSSFRSVCCVILFYLRPLFTKISSSFSDSLRGGN